MHQLGLEGPLNVQACERQKTFIVLLTKAFLTCHVNLIENMSIIAMLASFFILAQDEEALPT